LGDGVLDPHLTQCGQGRDLPARQVSSGSVQSFGHNTPTLLTGQTGPTGLGRQRSGSIGRTVLQTVAQETDQFFVERLHFQQWTGNDYDIDRVDLTQNTDMTNVTSLQVKMSIPILCRFQKAIYRRRYIDIPYVILVAKATLVSKH